MTPDLRATAAVWARIGMLSFGGPAGQIALMHHEVVDRRGWITEKQFLDALAFCQVIPGPEAQQLATYIGWRMHGLRGGLVAGGLFILPGAIVMMALAALYVAGADTGVVRASFKVVRPLVVVIVALALVRLGRRALKRWLDRFVAAGAFVSLFVFHLPFPLRFGSLDSGLCCGGCHRWRCSSSSAAGTRWYNSGCFSAVSRW